jgi:SAM-dependent methyltransferase
MRAPFEYSFPHYLAAKKSVDDRALNRRVWEALSANLSVASSQAPLRVLEVGAGAGAMLERMLDWGLLSYAHYTGIDSLAENIAAARLNLAARGSDLKNRSTEMAVGLFLKGSDFDVTVELEAVDVFDFVRCSKGKQQWDLLVAHAFLDLIDIPTTLPQLFSLLQPGGLFYFTINFDGLTLLEPAIEPSFDEQIQDLYHRTMDERVTDARPPATAVPDGTSSLTCRRSAQESRGRLPRLGCSSRPAWHPAGEVYFLHFIIQTIYQALRGHPELEVDRFERWIAARHAQIERCELTYIAHQLDFVGIWPGV